MLVPDWQDEAVAAPPERQVWSHSRGRWASMGLSPVQIVRGAKVRAGLPNSESPMRLHLPASPRIAPPFGVAPARPAYGPPIAGASLSGSESEPVTGPGYLDTGNHGAGALQRASDAKLDRRSVRNVARIDENGAQAPSMPGGSTNKRYHRGGFCAVGGLQERAAGADNRSRSSVHTRERGHARTARTPPPRGSMSTVALVSMKGGSGKSTAAVHIAIQAAQQGRNVALIDTDPQQSAAR